MRKEGMLVLDRKGEYIEDTQDQKGNKVFGLQNHPMAQKSMVVVSQRQGKFQAFMEQGKIYAHVSTRFSIKDVLPTDLADFLRSLTPTQADLIRDYSYIPFFYEKLLAQTRFGSIDKRSWYQDFPGLFTYSTKGKALLKKYEKQAELEGRYELSNDELDKLDEQEGSGGTKVGVLENAIRNIKRFCLSPFFGGTASGPEILATQSCVDDVLSYLEQGKCVFIDMRGLQDDEYTMIAALFARRLLNENKDRPDTEQIRACIVMEEAQNILREEELYKGGGRGSVFIELAREGRSFKLGFVLITQQPDARSVAPEVAKTIDTVVAFNMPPDDAKNLPRLKSAFSGLEVQVANTRIFQGVAVGSGGAVFFEAGPVTPEYMKGCVEAVQGTPEPRNETLDTATADAVEDEEPEDTSSQDQVDVEQVVSLPERLSRLSKYRQETIHKVSLATMNAWRDDAYSQESEADGL